MNQIRMKRNPSPKEESSLSRVLAKRTRKSLMQETKVTLMRALGNQSSVKVASKQQNSSNQIIMKAIARKYPEASHIVITTQPRTIGNKKSIFLVTPNCFRSLLSCLDFMSLFKIMQTRRDYRWDISTKGIGY